jgi:hypothetical protein
MLKVLRSSSRIIEGAGQVADLIAAARGQGRLEAARRHLLRGSREAPHPDRDQRRDHEAHEDADRDRDQQGTQPVTAKLIERSGQGRWRLGAHDHRAADMAPAGDGRRGDRHVPRKARPVQAPAERDPDGLRLLRNRRERGQVLPGRERVAMAVERPRLEVSGVRLCEQVGGVQLADLA